MNDFVQLFLELDQTTKTLNKIEALERFLIHASPPDRLWMIALLTGRGPKRVITSRLLKEWVLEITHLPLWLFEETYQVVGDLAEVLALVLPAPSSSKASSLSEWMLILHALKERPVPEKKKTILDLWDQMNPKEKLVFNKVLTGSFRLGVSQNLIIRALANVNQKDPARIAHLLMGNWTPLTVDPQFLTDQAEDAIYHTQPYPFCLAFPLDTEIENLGSYSDWFVEWKWDGIRAQIVHRHDALTIWSRGEEIVNERFPELLQLQAFLPPGIVLDGEILACREETILPFQFLQQRIGRKKITETMLKQIPVIFLAYDLLEWEGQDIRDYPFKERRKLLENFIAQHSESLLWRLSPQIQINNWEDLHQKRLESRDYIAEGVMLKNQQAPYHVGRKKGNWWKWKIDSYTIDAVLIYAQKGHGWRANVYSDYTFAIWDQGKLIPFTKAYSGLTKKELTEVDRFIKSNTLEKFGPVRSVKAELVFEIAFEGIQISKRHKSGIAVRFPRIQRWRHDKKPEDADTLETLKALIYTPI